MNPINITESINTKDYECPDCFRPISVNDRGEFSCDCIIHWDTAGYLYECASEIMRTIWRIANNIDKFHPNCDFWHPQAQRANSLIEIFEWTRMLEEIASCERKLKEQPDLNFIIEYDADLKHDEEFAVDPDYIWECEQKEADNEAIRNKLEGCLYKVVNRDKYLEFEGQLEKFYNETISHDIGIMHKWKHIYAERISAIHDNITNNKEQLLQILEDEYQKFQRTSWINAKKEIDEKIMRHRNSKDYIKQLRDETWDILSKSTLFDVEVANTNCGVCDYYGFINDVIMNYMEIDGICPSSITNIRNGRWIMLMTYFRRKLAVDYLENKLEDREFGMMRLCLPDNEEKLTPESVKSAFNHHSEYVREKIKEALKYYDNESAKLAVFEIAFFDCGYLKKKNQHTLFVNALVDWGLLVGDMTRMIEGITVKFGKISKINATEWEKKFDNEKTLYDNICKVIKE